MKEIPNVEKKAVSSVTELSRTAECTKSDAGGAAAELAILEGASEGESGRQYTKKPRQKPGLLF